VSSMGCQKEGEKPEGDGPGRYRPACRIATKAQLPPLASPAILVFNRQQTNPKQVPFRSPRLDDIKRAQTSVLSI
jgi:hypothetical protein